MTTWPAAPAELPALERTVHVWAVRLDDARVDLDGGRELLSPDERERAGKPQRGRLSLRAFHQGGQVQIEIADDGKGIDPVKMRKAALEKGAIANADEKRMVGHYWLRAPELAPRLLDDVEGGDGGEPALRLEGFDGAHVDAEPLAAGLGEHGGAFGRITREDSLLGVTPRR